ncbi:MAG: PKD domain-containing protein [Bacteroidota bacterium]
MKETYIAIVFLLLLASCHSDDDTDPILLTADFTASQNAIDEGESINFTDLSMGDPTAWAWTFEGGTPSSSLEQNPTVSYSVEGTYQVSLTVSSGGAEDTETKAGFITVSKVPVQTGLFDETIMHDGLEREYLLYIPDTYTGQEAVPIVFSLHGAIGTKEKQFELSQFDLIADQENFILVTPQATVPNMVTFWNNTSDPDKADDVGFINTLIDEMISRYNVDAARIYAAGSSNGGYMCLQLACELSDKIAAVAAVKGVMNDTQLANCNPSNPIPILQLHGTEDNNVSYSLVPETLQFWINFNQTTTTPQVFPVDDPDPNNGNTAEYVLLDSGLENTTVEHFRVIGGEHDWFGEPGTNYDINASEEAWKFFDKFRLNGINQ